MKNQINLLHCVRSPFSLAMLGLLCVADPAQAKDEQKAPLNTFRRSVVDAEVAEINYTREKLEAIESTASSVESNGNIHSQGFIPPVAGASPFWQYSIFGSGIGLSNIIIGSASEKSGAREIIIGGNSASDYGPDDFWQVISHNSATGNYDQLFVSPVYSATVKRIATGNVLGDSQQEIVVMLADGRIYLYDLTTKTELGHLKTGIHDLEGLSLTDLDGDGFAELIVTNTNDLFVFDRAGSLLWSVVGAGGYGVVAGQLDNDPALEIAATRGRVVDGATHTVQWTFAGGGSDLRLAPFPGANYQQLIVAQGANANAYDVAMHLLRWSVHPVLGVGAIEIADVDNDGIPELIVSDGPYGPIQVRDLITQEQKWTTDNPEYGITNIAVGDVDDDGVVDLLWGSGWDSNGPDYLFVASTTGARAVKWQSMDLVGPFAGPAIGDLDGDGQPELVVCSSASQANYFGGRILVFDPASLALRAISAPVVNDISRGVRDLKLRDVDGDGQLEIVLATDRMECGMIKIYNFDSSNNFTLKWTNTSCIGGSPFTFVEVADLDGDGTREIIAGNSVTSTGTSGVNIYIYSYPSSVNPWRSMSLAPAFYELTGLVVDDLDGDGRKEIAALASNGYLYTFDGPTRQLSAKISQPNARVISNHSPSGLILGDYAGAGHFLQYSPDGYSETFRRRLAPAAIDGINVLSNGELWTGSGKALSLRVPPAYDHTVWQSPVFGVGLGRFVATDYYNGQTRVFSSSQSAVAGFIYESTLPPPTPQHPTE